MLPTLHTLYFPLTVALEKSTGTVKSVQLTFSAWRLRVHLNATNLWQKLFKLTFVQQKNDLLENFHKIHIVIAEFLNSEHKYPLGFGCLGKGFQQW